jgi:hypothetical protein
MNDNVARMETDLEFRPNSLILFVGSSYSGKTHLLQNVLIDMLDAGKFKFGVVFCSTLFNNGWEMFDDKIIKSKFTTEWLRAYLDLILTKYTVNGKFKYEPSFMIFDDMIGQIDLMDPFIQWFLSVFRHFGITLFISTQFINRISTLHREQANYAFVWPQKTRRSLEAIYESLCGDLDHINDLKDLIKRCTAGIKYAALFIDCHDPDPSTKYKGVLARKELPERKYIL